jgi:hypothetical protein
MWESSPVSRNSSRFTTSLGGESGIEAGAGYFAIIHAKQLKKTKKHMYNCGAWVTEAVTG